MKRFFNQLYLMPNSMLFQSLEYLNTHFRKISLSLLTLIFIYPIVKAIQYHDENQALAQTYHLYTQEAVKKAKLFANLQQKQTEINGKNKILSSLSQNLEQLFRNYYAEVENIQWGRDNGNTISVIVNHRAKIIFRLIYELTKLDMLRIKEMTLIKLERDNLIQLHATLHIIK